jgi:hypothetical protein
MQQVNMMAGNRVVAAVAGNHNPARSRSRSVAVVVAE